MMEVFRHNPFGTRALVDLSAGEVQTLVRALRSAAASSLELVASRCSAEDRARFAAEYDLHRTLAERLELLKL